MMSAWETVAAFVKEQSDWREAVRRRGNDMLDLLAGNLRGLSPSRLRAIKRELHDFDAMKGKWKT